MFRAIITSSFAVLLTVSGALATQAGTTTVDRLAKSTTSEIVEPVEFPCTPWAAVPSDLAANMAELQSVVALTDRVQLAIIRQGNVGMVFYIVDECMEVPPILEYRIDEPALSVFEYGADNPATFKLPGLLTNPPLVRARIYSIDDPSLLDQNALVTGQ